jgi:hypothetical protein
MRCDEVACPQRCWNGLCVFGDKVLQSCGMVDPGVEPKGRGVQGSGPSYLWSTIENVLTTLLIALINLC